MSDTETGSDEEYDSEEYITASSSSEDTWTNRGVQFVKPRVYETGGRKWQPVIDKTGTSTTLDLGEKIKLWNINQKEGSSIDTDKVINNPSKVDKAVINTYSIKSTDIYIPGEYEERDHSGRSSAEILLYRTNIAFINRIKPRYLQPKSKGCDELFVNRSNSSLTTMQIKQYHANKQFLAALKLKYESKKTKLAQKSSTNVQEKLIKNYKPFNPLAKSRISNFEDIPSLQTNKTNIKTTYSSKQINTNPDEKISNEVNPKTDTPVTIKKQSIPAIRYNQEKIKETNNKPDSKLVNDERLFSDSKKSYSANDKLVQEVSEDNNCDKNAIIAPLIAKSKNILKNEEKNPPDEKTINQFTVEQNDQLKNSSNMITIANTLTPQGEVTYHTFVDIEANLQSKWKKQAINGTYAFQGLNEYEEPYYLRVFNDQSIYISLWSVRGNRKWRIGPDYNTKSSWMHTKKRTIANGIPVDGWYECDQQKWSKVGVIKIRTFNE